MAYQDFLNVRDRVAFGQGPYTASPSWTDITKPDNLPDNAVRPGGTFTTGRSSRTADAQAASITLQVGNRDGRYTPHYSGSPYYPFSEAAPYCREVEYPKGSGTWWPLWGGAKTDANAGFVEDAKGVASLTFQQRLGLASKKPLKALAAGAMLRTNPAHFWPFDDEAGSVAAADPRGGDYPSMTPFYYGNGEGVDGGVYDFGAAFAPGETGGTRLALTPKVSDTVLSGYSFAANIPIVPSSGFQIVGVFSGDNVGNEGEYRNIVTLEDPIDNVRIALVLRYDGHPCLYKFPVSGTGSGVLVPAGTGYNLDDGQDHSFGLSIHKPGIGTTTEVWIDGVKISSGTGFYVPRTPLRRFTKISVGTVVDPSIVTPFSGTFANVASWYDVDDTRHAAASDAATGYGSDTADGRFARLADAAGYAAEWIVTVGDFTRVIAPQQVAGRQFIDLVKEVEAAEVGRLVVDQTGRLVLASNSAFHTPLRTLTLSADTDFHLDGEFGTDSDGLVNSWTGSRDGGPTLVYEAPQDVIDDHGYSTDDDPNLPLTTDDDVLQVGHWKVETRSVPVIRLPQVKVNAAKLHAAGVLDDALALCEGDQVVLTDLPTGSPETEFTGFIERIEYEFTPSELVFVFTLSEWRQVALFDEARFDADPDSITLNASMTAAATTVVVNTESGHPPLTADPADLPFDIDVLGERMTVTAVSSATSPQTLTVTRGVSPTTASTKPSGASVRIWRPGIYGI